MMRSGCAPILLAVATVCAPLAQAEEATEVDSVVELFTSHGCYSCPPADELLGRLANRNEHLLLLEFHVDYWNSLVYGGNGSFTDPFSKPEWSLLQRAYNGVELHGRPGVYTPQAIVNGRYALVGNDAHGLRKTLHRAPEPETALRIGGGDEEASLRVDVAAGTADSTREIWLYRYLDHTVTDITGGENKSKQLTNHNVVTVAEKLADWRGQAVSVEFAPPPAGEGCAVILRGEGGRGMFGAVRCP